jgi:hypothetical protein
MKYLKNKKLFESNSKRIVLLKNKIISSRSFDVKISFEELEEFAELTNKNYKEIFDYSEQLYNTLNEIDIDLINDRLYELYDELPDINKQIFKAISTKNGFMTIIDNIKDIISYILTDSHFKNVKLSSYKPSVIIRLYDETSNMNLSEIENILDDILPTIENENNVEDVIWSYNRYNRMYDSNMKIEEYILKLIF